MSRRGSTAASGAVSDPTFAEYTAEQAVPKPDGATFLTVEVISSGENGSEDEDNYYAGHGGGYARRERFDVSALTSAYVGNGGVRVDNSSGPLICAAGYGDTTAGFVGDVKYAGGVRGVHPSSVPYGGGAAGRDGPGYGSGGLSPPVANDRGGYLYGYAGHTGTDKGLGARGGDGQIGGPWGVLLMWQFD